MQLLWFNHVCLGLDLGSRRRTRSECTSLHTFPPGALTLLHIFEIQASVDVFFSVRGVICAFPSVHLTVNLNASTFDVKPHSGDTDPCGSCPGGASSLVWGQFSLALGKGFSPWPCANYQQHLHHLMDCRTVAYFPKLLPSSYKGLSIFVFIMGWTISVAFWPPFVSLKSKWGWFPCHYKVISLWGYSTGYAITWVSQYL